MPVPAGVVRFTYQYRQRPFTSYDVFEPAQRNIEKLRNPTWSAARIRTRVANEWRRLAAAQKAPWIRKAARHNARMRAAQNYRDGDVRMLHQVPVGFGSRWQGCLAFASGGTARAGLWGQFDNQDNLISVSAACVDSDVVRAVDRGPGS